ncbi:MAG: hypothetical protein LBT45_01175 [Rickettsiales bacterium]|jgi:hypothetical protein|nr:hypothetical protein [Rickettsiales bacterium]
MKIRNLVLLLPIMAACASAKKTSVKSAPVKIDYDKVCTSENPIPMPTSIEEGDIVFASCDGKIRKIGDAPAKNAPSDLPDNERGLKYISIACAASNREIDVWNVKPMEHAKEGASVKQAEVIGRAGMHRDGRGNYVVTVMYDGNRKLYMNPAQVLFPGRKAEECEKTAPAPAASPPASVL